SGACCAPSPATTGPGSTRWSRTRPPSRTSPTGASCSSPSRATGTRSSRRRSSLSSRCCGRRDVAARPTGTTVRELLAASPAAHRWVAAPAQTAHDAAALWAFLAQAPARVKADGELYARAWPKLIEALPPIDGLDAAGFGAMRVEMALELLRTSGFLRLRVG